VSELERFRESFGDWALGDVKKAHAGGAKVGAFILAAHFIDALARLSKKKGDGKAAWDEFVPAFLPAYAGEAAKLYRFYRGKLSHQYSLRDFRLVDGEDYRHRHWALENGDRVLHLESFIEDLERAWSHFSEKLDQDAQFRERVLERAREDPPLTIVQDQAGTASAASSLTRLSQPGAWAGATHFGPVAADWPVRWEDDAEKPDPDPDKEEGSGGEPDA
jgi:hypothetical protein